MKARTIMSVPMPEIDRPNVSLSSLATPAMSRASAWRRRRGNRRVSGETDRVVQVPRPQTGRAGAPMRRERTVTYLVNARSNAAQQERQRTAGGRVWRVRDADERFVLRRRQLPLLAAGVRLLFGR